MNDEWDVLAKRLRDKYASELEAEFARDRREEQVRKMVKEGYVEAELRRFAEHERARRTPKPADKPGITTINLAEYEIGIAYNGEA